MLDIFIVFALLASAISTNKIILLSISPILFVGIRMLCAGLILLLINYFKKNKFDYKKLKKDFIYLFLITLFTTYLPVICKSYALKHMQSSKAAFFGTLDPFITAIYSYFLFGEKLNIRKIIGIIIASFGAGILLVSPNSETNFLSFLSLPEISALVAVATGRLGWILAQSLLKKNEYSPIQLNSITMTASGVLSFATSLAIEPSISFNFTGTFYGLMGYTIIMGNVISLTLYAFLLKKYSATLISLAGFSVPLFVHVYGYLFLNEPISVQFFLSLAITLIGFIIFSLTKKSAKNS